MLLIYLFFLPLLLAAVAHDKPTNPKKYRFNHTTMRIKDPKVSLKFYTEVLGMKYITSLPLESNNMTLYFVSHVDQVPEDEEKKKLLAFSTPGVLELMHIWGTEDKPGRIYANGNDKDNLGYAHIGLLVDDINKASDRLKKLGVHFEETPEQGNYRTVAFITDPDGYWIELIQDPAVTGYSPV